MGIAGTGCDLLSYGDGGGGAHGSCSSTKYGFVVVVVVGCGVVLLLPLPQKQIRRQTGSVKFFRDIMSSHRSQHHRSGSNKGGLPLFLFSY